MYKVEITHNQDMSFTAKIGESECVIDAKGKGLTPLDTLLAGLASCIGVYIRKYAEGAKLDLVHFKVDVSAELNKEYPVSFKKIMVGVDLKGCQLDERRKIALLAFIKNCPAHNTLKGNPEIDFNLSC